MSLVLAIVAHPDDEVIGPGGTLIRHVGDGDEVHVLIVADGRSSRGASSDAERLAIELSARECAAAREIIGYAETHRLDLPDNALDSLPLLSVVKAVGDYVERLRPEIVYTHYEGDLNIDHGVVGRAVRTATRPIGPETPQLVLAFPTLSSTEWSFDPLHRFCPNWFVDITGRLERKLDAMRAYAAELRDAPHPRSLPAIEAQARLTGTTIGCEAAEPFALVRRCG